MSSSVLVVDDDQVVRNLVVRLLEDAFDNQLTLIEAIDGQDAMEKLKQHSVDLLITDIFMPKVNGFNLTLHASEQNPTLKTIVFTSESNLASKTRNLLALAQNSGANFALSKESLPEQLPNLVKQCLNL